MAPYLLQWEAIKYCKAKGCRTYDFLGIAPLSPSPPEGEGRASQAREGEGHPWQGISDFKAKFGGTVLTYPPEQEVTLRPVMKGLLEMKRYFFG